MTSPPADRKLALSLDAQASDPPFIQIQDQLVTLIRTGELAPGDRLPTVRALAAQLDVAVNTVARSYRELEHEGILETLGRRGTFVAPDDDPVRRAAAAEAESYAASVTRLGMPPCDALELVARALGLPR